MKILYVLVSSENDFYYEQALISMMSAKHQMPNCFISLLTERETDDRLKGSRNLINEYISEKIVIDLVSSLSPMQKSRWLKTSMRDLIKGDFLYVDVDTVFAGPVDEALFTDEIMGVPDGNCPLEKHPMRRLVIENLKKMGYSVESKYHINSGVLFFKDSPETHLFSNLWHNLWQETQKRDICIDQIALHQAIAQTNNKIGILPDCWNAQFGRNINTLATGIILHYYSSWTNNMLYKPAYKFLQKDWLLQFRANPKAKAFQAIIQNPKKAFDANTLIMGNGLDGFFYSRLGHQLATIHASSNNADERLFNILEKVIKFFVKIYYRTIKIFYPIKKLINRTI